MGGASRRISTSSETVSLCLETGFESSQGKDSMPTAESAFGCVKELFAFLCCLMNPGKNYFQKICGRPRLAMNGSDSALKSFENSDHPVN